MRVRKYRYSPLTGNNELIREFPDIDEQVVLSKMATDTAFTVGHNIPGYEYQGGTMVGNRFIPEIIWTSENPNLFD